MLDFMKQYFPKLLAFVVAILIFIQVLPSDYDPFNGSGTSVSTISDSPLFWSKEQVVDYYKKAAAATDGKSVQTISVIELPSTLNSFKLVINSALAAASISTNGITGGYQNLTASDLTSARAFKLGNYIYVNLSPKDQTDGIYGKKKEGTVGHVVDVLDGVATAVQAIGLPAEYPEGSVKLDYKKAYAKNVKINAQTGKIESGEWGYNLYVSVNGAKLSKVTLKDVNASFSFKVKYPA